MRKLATVLAVTAALLTGAVAAAGPASADTRHCYTPHVAGYPSYEVCYYLPIEFTQ